MSTQPPIVSQTGAAVKEPIRGGPTLETAFRFERGARLVGEIDGADRHYFVVHLDEGEQLAFKLYMQEAIPDPGSGGKAWAAIVDSEGGILQESYWYVEHSGTDFNIGTFTYTAKDGGDHWLRVRFDPQDTNPRMNYKILVS